MARKLTKEEFQDKLNKNCPLKYTIIGEYLGGSKEITVVHDKCGKTIKQKYAKNLFKVRSCPHCNPENHFDTEEQVKIKLQKYNILLLSKYKNEREKVKLQYPCGCIYFKTLSQIKAGSGVTCSMCTGRIKNHVISKDEANLRLKSGAYGTYSIVGKYTGMSNKTDIKCDDCGYIRKNTTPTHILKRVQGCEVCSGTTKSVKERFIKQLLFDLKIEFISEKRFKGIDSLRADIYIPSFNLVIEFDGGYHDICDSQIERDNIKNEYFELNNIKLLRIHHKDDSSIALKIIKELKL